MTNSHLRQLSGRYLFPIRENLYGFIRLAGIIRNQVYAKIMFAAHIAVHHERHGHGGLLAGIDNHRTDGRYWRSTPRRDFDVRLFRELQRLIAGVGQFK